MTYVPVTLWFGAAGSLVHVTVRAIDSRHPRAVPLDILTRTQCKAGGETDGDITGKLSQWVL